MCSCDPEPKEPTLEVKPNSQRHCTDLLFVGLFLGLWVAEFIILGNAISQGADPDKIIRGVDYKGSICGKSSDETENSLAAWPLLEYYDIKECVNSCNKTEDFDPAYQSSQFLYYCLPTYDLNGTGVELSGDFDSASEGTPRAVGDLWTSWPLIFASAFMALVMAFFYTWLVKKCGGFVIWAILVLIILGGFLAGYGLLKAAANADEDETQTTNRSKAMKGLGWLVVGVTFIFLFIIFALRKRIEIAIQVTEEAAKALLEMPALVFFPLLPFVMAVGYMAIWIIIAIYIFSVTNTASYTMPDEFADIFPGVQNYTKNEWNEDMQNSFSLHFFHLLWNVQFLIYFSYCVIAGTVADWYFTPRQSPDGPKRRGDDYGQLSNHPIVESMLRVLRFHLGTIAFGALIIAIINFLRACVRYAEEHSKAENANQLQRAVFCAISCCLKCAECCCDKVNKNAFVWTAIYGDGFVPAACSSFALIWSNLARVAAISVVGDTLLLIGKFIVALMTVGVMALAINAAYDISSLALPAMVIFLLSYLVASLYMSIFETTIDTIFLCFLVDEKYNKDTGQMLAPASLISLVDTHASLSAQTAQKQKQSGLSPTGYTQITD